MGCSLPRFDLEFTQRPVGPGYNIRKNPTRGKRYQFGQQGIETRTGSIADIAEGIGSQTGTRRHFKRG